MILTDEEIRKAAEFAAEQMWPESGYVRWTEDDAVYHRKFIEAALLEKLRGGVELPEAEYLNVQLTTDHEHGYAPIVRHIDAYSADQLLAYGAAQRLAAREQAIEECAAECLVPHANGNYKHDTREDCHDAIRALAASPQEQT